jgi:hypothetical protein
VVLVVAVTLVTLCLGEAHGTLRWRVGEKVDAILTRLLNRVVLNSRVSGIETPTADGHTHLVPGTIEALPRCSKRKGVVEGRQ